MPPVESAPLTAAPLTAADIEGMIARGIAAALKDRPAAAALSAPGKPKECDLPKPCPAEHEVRSISKRLRGWGAQLSNAERDTLLLALADKAGL